MSALGPDELADEFAAVAQQWMTATGTPGVALGVLLDGQVATRGLGVRSLQDPRPVTSRTLFRLCSVTKPFTATLAVGMDRDGLLGLDVPIADVIDVPLADRRAGRMVTMRHLLQHVSGLEAEWPVDLAVFGPDGEAVHRLVAEFGLLRQFATPGRHWGYCNTGYWLAAAALSRAGRADFEDLMSARVLAPLGMTRAGFGVEPEHAPVAAGHERGSAAGTVTELPWLAFPRARHGSGGLMADVDDLMNFVALHLGAGRPRLLPGIDATALAEIVCGTLPTGEPDEFQALGFQTVRYPGGEIVKHSGGYPGYGARVVLVPSLGLGLAVLTNATGGGELGVRLQELVATRMLGWTDPGRPSPVAVPATALAGLRGSYVLPESVSFTVEPASDRLRFCAEDRAYADADFVARPLSDGDFVVSEGRDVGALVQFLPDDDGRPTVLRYAGWMGGRVPAPSAIGMAGRHLERLPQLRALQSVPTPALVISEAAVGENIDRALQLMGSPAVWRPHLKTARIGWTMRRLQERGVRRCKVSTVAELDVAIRSGFRDVLLAYPVVGPRQWAVSALAARHPQARISVLVDDAAALETWRGRLSVFVDLDTGGHRTGVDVADDQQVRRLVEEITAHGHTFAGLHSYDGHLADLPGAVREHEVGVSLRAIGSLCDHLARAGHVVPELVAGSTHTYRSHLDVAARADGLPPTTVGPGTLVYADLQTLERSRDSGYVVAAGVLTRVVSVGADGVTVDAGLTAVQTDAGRPHAQVVGHDGLVVGNPSQEHLMLRATARRRPPLGSLLLLAPRHLDTSIAQFPQVHVVAGDGSVHREPAAGRWSDVDDLPL